MRDLSFYLLTIIVIFPSVFALTLIMTKFIGLDVYISIFTATIITYFTLRLIK